jgi:MSHA biogenesis protein MshM
MYQDFFNLHDFPFNQFPNKEYYFDLENHKQSLDVLNIGLKVNDGIIKITGKSGTGKSLLCRLFMDKISENYFPIYILNPYFDYKELLQLILTELKVDYSKDDSSGKLSELFYLKVSDLSQNQQKLVLIFDEAQYINKEGLEVIQIFSNCEARNKAQVMQKLCQIILVGGLSLDKNLADCNHLLQRVSFSHTLNPVAKEDLESYIYHRLNKATKGNQNHGVIFSPNALSLLYKTTNGVPRLINIVCHKALMLAYSLGTKHITKKIINQAAKDTDSIQLKSLWKRILSRCQTNLITDNLK